MATKKQIISDAFEAFGLAGYVFDLQPAQLEAAQRTLDAMMAGWGARGIRVGYAPGGLLDDESGLPDLALEAVTLGLALRLAPGFGKTVSPDTQAQARAAYSALLTFTAQIPPMRINPGFTPAGAGNRQWFSRRAPFLAPEPPSITTGDDGILDILT
jgi:hypothetical protein